MPAIIWLVLFLPADSSSDRAPHFVSYAASRKECLDAAQTTQQVADLNGKGRGIAVCVQAAMLLPKKGQP